MLRIAEYRNVLGEDGKSIRREKIDLKELEKENNKLTYARDWYFENTVNKLVTPEMLHKILRTKYIGRDKIENKIELYKRLELESFNRDSIQADEYRAIIKVLQKLLEEK